MNGASSEQKRSHDKVTELETRIQELDLELTQAKEALQSEKPLKGIGLRNS